MKFPSRYFLFPILFVGFVSITSAQIEVKDIMRAGAVDGEKYFEQYLAPGFISFNNGLSSGWYNTAKTHKLFGIDLTVTANFATIPEEMRNFTFNNNDYSVLRLENGNSAQLPTIGGGNTNTNLVVKAGIPVEGTTYANDQLIGAASGVGNTPFNAVPTPTLTLGIGLPKNTDLKIRYIPSINAGDFSLDYFGIGVMHDLKQWIPGIKLAPFDFSGFVGTTTMTTEIAFSVNEPNFTAENGRVIMKTTSTTIQAIISKKIGILTPYAGIGYNIASSNFDVKGRFQYNETNGSQSNEVIDPISVKFSEGNTPRVTLGARFKLLVMTFHADYTFQKYSTFSAGVGISVR
jgi:hypothetical protein